MTTANVTNLGMKSSASGSVNKTMDVRRKVEETAGMFGAMMSQFGNQRFQTVKDGEESLRSVSDTKKETDKTAYADQMSYAENTANVKEISDTAVSEEIASTEEAENVEQSILTVLEESLGVSEEEIISTLEELGITVFDLLNPQNLGDFVMQLSDMESQAQLLLDPEFVDLMGTIQQIGDEWMNQLGLEPEQMDRFIQEMDMLSEPVALDGVSLEGLSDAGVENLSADQADVPLNEVQDAGIADQEVTADGKIEAEVTYEEPVMENEMSGDESADQNSETDSQPKLQNPQETKVQVQDHPMGVANEIDVPIAETVMETPQTQTTYMSTESMDILHQIVERVQLSVRAAESSFEMQLNPENLGKVYVNIVAKEGVVSAQFTATSEAVRAALEAQVADLRENLNQAGVKVDAIEVTVASHGFEENLEQNARQEEQAARQAERNRSRRNLTLRDMDELSGVMTEEEILVAQMMKENGNSMDVTV